MRSDGYSLWTRHDRVTARIRLRRAHAVDLILETRGERPLLAPAQLALHVLERAIDEPGTAAVAVLPHRVCWLLDEWSELEGTMTSFRAQAGEYAEIFGAPEGRVWQRGFWYRPLADGVAAARRAGEIVRLPVETGVLDRYPGWPVALSSLAF
jgi:hypothetical protein